MHLTQAKLPKSHNSYIQYCLVLDYFYFLLLLLFYSIIFVVTICLYLEIFGRIHSRAYQFFIFNETRAHFPESKTVPQGCLYSTIRFHFVQNKLDSLLITFQEKPLLCFGCETVKSVSPVSLVEHIKIFIFH